MATRGPAYGLSRECQIKTNSKFDMDLAREALQWIQQVTGKPVQSSRGQFLDQLDVQEPLKDGQLLCEVMNHIFPNSIRRINRSTLPFKERENIEMFVKACLANGMTDVDLFQVEDLYEAKSMYTVINCLHTLGSMAQKSGFNGPVLGVRHSQKNQRSFSDDTLAQGRTVIGLQMGSNVGASQAGMTAPGTYRHM